MAPFMASTPRHHVVGRPQPLQEHHEGEGIPAARPAAPVVVGPGGDPDRLPAVLAETVQLLQEDAHRPVLGLLAPLLDILADRVLPHERDAISGGGPTPNRFGASRLPAHPSRSSRSGGRPRLQVARITFDIVRPLPIAELQVTTRLLRGGRSVELVEATMRAGKVEVMRA